MDQRRRAAGSDLKNLIVVAANGPYVTMPLGADSDAGGQVLISRPSGETERPSLDLSVAGDLAKAVDFEREEKSYCSVSTGGRKRKLAPSSYLPLSTLHATLLQYYLP